MKLHHLCLIFSLAYSSCVQRSSDTTPAGPTVTPEISECNVAFAYPSPVVVNGTANFYKRTVAVSGAGANVSWMVLGAANATPIPIQFAEIRILNAAGETIQCGTTNATGQLKAVDGTSNLNLPAAAGDYIVQVWARTNHIMTGLPVGKSAFKLYASVKSDIYSNEVHKISQTVSSTGVGTVTANLTAYARESESAEIKGGAFNIYNNIVVAYKYLAQNTGTSSLACLSPKLEVFWRAGFNPSQYLYPSADPSTLSTLSFYLRGYNQLFINGGRVGNVTSQDTDHFDDAVIIHELGHRIEDVCGKMDSPGGTHYGLYRIDPRLAWSEGWGNFFGAHIIRNNLAAINPDLPATLAGPKDGWLYYLDTRGYTEGGAVGTELIRLNLNRSGASPEPITVDGNLRYYDRVNSVTAPGEGHFREVSVARSLFKSTNTCTATCTNCSSCANANYFDTYWKAFENDPLGIGMGKTSYPFRSSMRFYNRLNQAFAGTTPAAIDSILNTDEAQQRDGNAAYTVGGHLVYPPFATKLVPSGVACNLKIQPAPPLGLTSDAKSDLRFSNHFYMVDLTAIPGVSSIRLNATQVSGSSHDIDLILYTQNFKFNGDCVSQNTSGDCTVAQKLTPTEVARVDRSAGLVKQVTAITSLDPSQPYLLNVRAFPNTLPASASEYSYTLTDQSGGFLCPAAY